MLQQLIVIGCAITGMLAQWDMKLDVHCDHHTMNKVVNDNSQKNVTDLCGHYFHAYAYGLTDALEKSTSAIWTAKAALTSRDKSVELSSEMPGMTYGDVKGMTMGDDVTAIFTGLGPITISVAQTECDNIVLVASLTLESTDGIMYSTYTTTRLWCDFSGVNLKVESSDPNPAMVEVPAGGAINIPSAVTVTPSVTGTLPTLANDDCYFATAFITQDYPYDCSSAMAGEATDVKYNDHVMGVPMCFKSAAELQTVDFRAMVDGMFPPTAQCGMVYLVLMLDPLHSAATEPTRCDNYVTFTYNIQCPNHTTDEGMCEIIMNGWNSKDTRTVYYNPWTNMPKMFSYGDGWESGDMHSYSRVEKIGYGSLKVLGSYIQQTMPSSVVTAEQINAFEEFNTENIFDTSKLPNIQAMIDVFNEELNNIDTTDASNADQMMNTAYSKFTAVMSEIPATMLENVTRHVKLAAYNATMLIAKTKFIDNNDMEINHRIAMLECRLPEELYEFMSYIDKELFDSNYTKGMYMNEYYAERLNNVTATFTMATLLMAYTYPDFTCVQSMYKNYLLYLTERMDSSTPDTKPSRDWWYDSQRVGETSFEDFINDCEDEGRVINKCIKKIRGTCRKERWTCDYKDITTEDLGHSLAMSMYAKGHYSSLGLSHIQNGFLDMWDQDGKTDPKHCEGEPLEYKYEPLQLWKYDPGMVDGSTDVILQGLLSLDNKQVCWKKAALCTCNQCYSRK